MTCNTVVTTSLLLCTCTCMQGPVIVASPYGGVNIEEVAKTSPSYIYKDAIDITTGVYSVYTE